MVSHPDTNPAGQQVTLVNFSITKLSDAQRARLNLWLKEVVRELQNYQHVSPEANVSRFSFICYSSETGMAVVQYHTIQCLLIFCNTYHRQSSVCFTEASRYKLDSSRGSSFSRSSFSRSSFSRGPLFSGSSFSRGLRFLGLRFLRVFVFLVFVF